MVVSTADRRVKKIVVDHIAYAYAFKLAGEPPWDPELCKCQRVRPIPGTDRCNDCQEASDA